MSKQETFVILGAGQAGGWVAMTLRNEGFEGRIVLLGDEPHPPYERPPLSKDVLKGEATLESTYITTVAALAELNVDCWFGELAAAIDREARRVTCASGRTLDYDTLFITLGGAARKLPHLPASERVFYLRGLEDATRIGNAMKNAKQVLVIGGGWIGLEVAAAARSFGKPVVVAEAGAALCGRSLPPDVSAWLADLHRSQGVDLRLQQSATFEAHEGGVLATFPDGSRVDADLVVVGIGLVPNVELAQASGLHVEDGIVTDAQGRTSDPRIFAAGDVANHHNRHSARRLRLESWANAQNQAIVAAKAALGHDAEYHEIPWFWSDQYDSNLQILGLPPAGVPPVVRIYNDSKRVYFYLVEGKLQSVIAINAGRDIKVCKKWMLAGVSPVAADLADGTRDLQKLPAA